MHKLLLLVALGFSVDGLAESSDSNFSFRVGTLTAKYSGFATVNAPNLSVVSFELASSLNKRISLVTGHRQAHSAVAGRNQVQTGYANLRLFPQYLSGIADQEIAGTRYQFVPKLTYFLESGMTMGKVMLTSYEIGGGLEATSDYTGFQLGAGLAVAIFKQFYGQIIANYESISGAGPFAAKGSNVVMQAGLSYHF